MHSPRQCGRERPICTLSPVVRRALRLHGQLKELPVSTPTDAAITSALMAVCPARTLSDFECESNADFALQMELDGRTQRFCANYFRSGDHMVRLLPRHPE